MKESQVNAILDYPSHVNNNCSVAISQLIYWKTNDDFGNILLTASPVSTCGSLLCTGSSSDMMEVSASEDEGLVIEAPEKLDDL